MKIMKIMPALEASIEQDLEMLQTLKAQRDLLDSQVKEVQDRVVTAMEALDRKTFTMKEDGHQLQATVVRGSRMDFNEPGLKRALGSSLWAKVSVSKLDKKKLEEAIGAGIVDTAVVAQYATEKFNQPYVKITEKLDVSEEAEEG